MARTRTRTRARSKGVFQSRGQQIAACTPAGDVLDLLLLRSRHPCAFQTSFDVPLVHHTAVRIASHGSAWQHSASTGACKGAARALRYLSVCWAKPVLVSRWYQLAQETRRGDLVVRAAEPAGPVSSALCAQARSESQRTARGQPGRRIPVSNSVTRGARFSHLREPARPAICVYERDALFLAQANSIVASALGRGFGSMQGLTATPRRVNASRSLAFHLGSMSDSASAYRPHVSRIHPLHPENCNCSQYDPCRPPMRALLLHTWWSTYHEATLLRRCDYDPAIGPAQPSYRPPSSATTPFHTSPLSP